MESLDGKDVPSPGEVAGLLGTMQRTMSRLAQTDMTALTAAEQFEVLAALETVDAMRAAVRGEAGAVFEANGGYDEYGYAGLVSCVQAKLNITRGKARSYKSWAKRARQHPLIIAALKGGLISESLAEQLMSWSEALKDPDLTAKMDDVLLAGALAGLSQADLRGLYEEARALAAPADEDGPEPPDRRLDLTTTLDGAGILRGELTPECAALLQAGLEAFAKQKAGADDNRGYAVRCHDALVQLLKIALRSGDVPQSNGQDTTATVILPLHELRGMDGASAIEDRWARQMHAAWRGQLTAAHGANGGGATWLYGDEARAVACDAMLAPVVTGHLQPAVFAQIIEIGHQLHQLTGQDENSSALSVAGLELAAARDQRVLELFLKLTGLVADAVSGPGGLASVLRTGLFNGSALGKTSLPLDCGDTDYVRPHLRRALNLRHPVCARPGCEQPAYRCQCHHAIPRAMHGPTSMNNCANLCYYHHQILIHKLGWTITVNNAGIVTVRKPDGTIDARAP